MKRIGYRINSHLQGGVETSLATPRSFSFSFLSSEGKTVQCKSVADAPLGLVRDGTGCGPGRVCVGTSCVEMMQVRGEGSGEGEVYEEIYLHKIFENDTCLIEQSLENRVFPPDIGLFSTTIF